MRITTRSIRARRRSRAEGQSLVEFALVLTPLFLIILGIVQFGFIFNAYVTMTNAAREAARDGVDLRLRPDADRRPRTTPPATPTIRTTVPGLDQPPLQDLAPVHDDRHLDPVRRHLSRTAT